MDLCRSTEHGLTLTESELTLTSRSLLIFRLDLNLLCFLVALRMMMFGL